MPVSAEVSIRRAPGIQTEPALVPGWWILAVSLLCGVALAGVPTVRQDQSYHAFADTRTIWGLRNFWNVASNLAFAWVGIVGWRRLGGPTGRLMSVGLILTGLGSTFYHWAPDNGRLLWDRLPMTLVFMTLLTWIVTDGRARRWELAVVVALGLGGIGSVLWWRVSGDLRPYALVQFGPILVLLPAFRSAQASRWLWAMLGCYALAKAAESWDRAVYLFFPLSGHTLKHLIAAVAALCIVRWRCERKDVSRCSAVDARDQA